MERIRNNKPAGISGNALRAWGLLFLALGVIGRGVIQTHMLGLANADTQQILEIMSSSETAMGLATTSIILQAVETCAAPIFAFLLVEGMQHTSDRVRYLMRVLGVAVISELPYNLAMCGRILAMESRNPVFGMVLSMIMILFYQRYGDKGFANTLIKLVITVAAMGWGAMLNVDSCTAVVLIAAVLWGMRERANYRNFVGTAAAVVCSTFSPFFLASPMGFLAVHLYNGKKCDTSPLVKYLAYPAMLLAAAIAGFLL